MKVLYSTDLRECSDMDLMCKVSDKSEYNVDEKMTFDQLVQSLSPAKKSFALSLIELYKRDKVDSKAITKISCSDDIYQVMYPHLYGVDVEEFWVIFMNNAAKILKIQRLGIGGRTSCLVDVRVVIKEALLSNATCIAVIHSHPSGNPRPSNDDDNITKKLKQATEICNIRLLDHLVFAQENSYSYADEGRL